ncbi:hypothetical protein BCR34DRAFT_588358 [Clohesyomyces aquaticus]|uniref:Uncharacterized protein n=1 Tax=Clohesyomyces aquaticus TaxID=1231657 RepID=A0A1Y1ZKS0_9PLEO|nr:hypothetical protein BCR34DRAFT_588358 [Clohesyomyces aquaticus]
MVRLLLTVVIAALTATTLATSYPIKGAYPRDIPANLTTALTSQDPIHPGICHVHVVQRDRCESDGSGIQHWVTLTYIKDGADQDVSMWPFHAGGWYHNSFYNEMPTKINPKGRLLAEVQWDSTVYFYYNGGVRQIDWSSTENHESVFSGGLGGCGVGDWTQGPITECKEWTSPRIPAECAEREDSPDNFAPPPLNKFPFRTPSPKFFAPISLKQDILLLELPTPQCK